MARLPQPGADVGTWGAILNDFLLQSHNRNGTLKSAAITADTLASSTGVNGQVLTYDSKASGSLRWMTLSAPSPTVTSLKLDGDLTGSTDNAQISAGVVGTDELADQSVAAAKLADGAVTATKLSAGSGTTGQALILDSSAPGGFKWQTLSLGSATPTGAAGGALSGIYPDPTLADGAVTTTTISDNNVTTAKLADGAVSTAKLANASITGAKIANGTIQEANLDPAIITKINTAASGTQVNADWNATSGAAEILNKPALGTAASANTSDFATAAQGAKADAAVQPDTLSKVATSGSYNDLADKPTIATGLSALSDVEVMTPASNQILVYDTAKSKWVNQATEFAPSATTSVEGTIQLTGDLGGSATKPTVVSLHGITLPQKAPTAGQILVATDATTFGWQALLPLNNQLVAWTAAEAYQMTTITRAADETIQTATVIWPDGGTGTLTVDTANATFAGAIDAYHITYTLNDISHTVTQTLVTRDSAGQLLNIPPLTVS